MAYHKPKSKIAISGKMSLYSAFSIISVIIICAAAWNLLDLAKITYLNTLKGSGKEIPKQQVVRITQQQNPLLRKLLVAFYLAKAEYETTKVQAALKENENKAIKLLKKNAKAQEIYKNYHGYYADNASELIIEENGKFTIIDPQLKVLNTSYNKENPADGYYYVEIVKKGSKGHVSSFFLSAAPARYGISGINTYCISNQTQVLKKNTRGKPVFDISSIDSSWEI